MSKHNINLGESPLLFPSRNFFLSFSLARNKVQYGIYDEEAFELQINESCSGKI